MREREREREREKRGGRGAPVEFDERVGLGVENILEEFCKKNIY